MYSFTNALDKHIDNKLTPYNFKDKTPIPHASEQWSKKALKNAQ